VLSPLRRRDFGLLWLGGLISRVGDWAMLAALPVYVYRLTGSTLASGLMFAALLGPRLLFGSVAGVYVDRWDRRRTLVRANLLLAANSLALALVDTPDRLWIVYGVAVVQATLAQVVQPAEGALRPLLVGPGELVRANSLHSLSIDAARLVGPPLGGLLVGLAGLPSAALLDAATFVVAAVLFGRIAAGRAPGIGAAAASAGGGFSAVWRDWSDGLRVVGRSRTLAVVFLFMALTGVGEGVMGALFAPFVVGVLGGDDAAFGWLLAAQAVGGLAGGAVIARRGDDAEPARLLGVGALGLGGIDLVIFNGPSLVPGLVLPLVLMVVVGLPATAMGVGRTTLLQAATEDAYRGRVIGALGATAAGFTLVGSLVGGLLGDRLGIVTMLNLDGIVYCLGGIIVLVALGPRAAPRAAESA
jgi:MFS family permease